jgi:ppGpp synthetase/RelA/SpoT-type nucleotidyltranferase
LLVQLLGGEGIQLHSVTSRCKTRDSIAGKIAKPDKNYSVLREITDVAGIRVVTYFAEDVDEVAAVVEGEFAIDREKSVDKRILLDPGRFGYQSLHYICTFTDDRCRLGEYLRFATIPFEVQVRSILQHAWAEIEHDLGYKSAVGVPREVRRRFARVAGLLELADSEFEEIRRELAAYQRAVPAEIRRQPQNVGIDKLSLRAVVQSRSSAIRRVSELVARAAHAELTPTEDAFLERSVRFARQIGLASIADLEALATHHLNFVEGFAKCWLGGSQYKQLDEAIGLLYLLYMHLAEKGDLEEARAFFESANISSRRDGMLRKLKAAYSTAIGEGSIGG